MLPEKMNTLIISYPYRADNLANNLFYTALNTRGYAATCLVIFDVDGAHKDTVKCVNREDTETYVRMGVLILIILLLMACCRK